MDRRDVDYACSVQRDIERHGTAANVVMFLLFVVVLIAIFLGVL